MQQFIFGSIISTHKLEFTACDRKVIQEVTTPRETRASLGGQVVMMVKTKKVGECHELLLKKKGKIGETSSDRKRERRIAGQKSKRIISWLNLVSLLENFHLWNSILATIRVLNQAI